MCVCVYVCVWVWVCVYGITKGNETVFPMTKRKMEDCLPFSKYTSIIQFT